jgi:quercetin dioxygenase-like cupin family protein
MSGALSVNDQTLHAGDALVMPQGVQPPTLAASDSAELLGFELPAPPAIHTAQKAPP